MSNSAIRRLQNDIHRLHVAERDRKKDAKAVRNDTRALNADKKQLAHAHDAFETHHKELTKDRKALGGLRDAEKKQLDAFEAKKADLQAQYDASVDPTTGQGDPAIQAKIDEVTAKEAEAKSTFDGKIAEKKQEVDKLAAQTDQNRKDIKSDRKEIAHDRKALQHDKKALAHAQDHVKSARKTALKHLRPAEYKMGLHQTNRARHELGLKAVHHVIRPMNLNTVQGCAQFLLHSKNVSFWSGLSSGSDRKNVELLAHGKPAFVPATGGHVFPKLSLMQALVDMAKHGPIQINALTGGIHTPGSNHYRGLAVDLDINVGNTSEIVAIANKHGGFRNSETDHIHLDF